MALRFSGRLSITKVVPSSRSMATFWNFLSSLTSSSTLASAKSTKHVARQRHAHDFGRAFGDHVAALVAPQPLDRQIGGQADAAVDLKAHVGRLPRHLGAEQLDQIGVVTVVLAVVDIRGGAVDQKRA